ncbi:MAG: hypothetical protein LBT83_01620 [Tannerella sp.]|jgi:hypothetical protein|nr:hypothetical protein [Tannerella sp.]
MKRLTVPYLPALDGLDLSGARALMELHATRESIDVLNWRESFPYKPIVAFDIARGREELYLHYFVRGLSVRALADRDGVFVHEDSCVEFFVRKADEMNYINFEFNCIGTCYACRHQSRQVNTPLTADEFRSLRRYTTLQSEAFAERPGLYDWELVVAIPFRLMGLHPERLPEMIRGNFYKCADKTENPHYVTWSPIDLPSPNYHCPEFFGEIFFAAR